MTINHTAGWWLGDLSGPYVQAIGESILAEWGTEPLWIREGGSIPGIPFLEQECEGLIFLNQFLIFSTAINFVYFLFLILILIYFVCLV